MDNFVYKLIRQEERDGFTIRLWNRGDDYRVSFHKGSKHLIELPVVDADSISGVWEPQTKPRKEKRSNK